jgi:hypothetical protein
MIENNIEQLIRENVSFSRKAATGFEQLKCACCNDYKIRAGFKFENEKIRYHCFNCSTEESYNEQSRFMSDEFRAILNSFHMDDKQIDDILARKFFSTKSLVKAGEKPKSQFILPQAIALPKNCYPINEEPNGFWLLVAEEYLALRSLNKDSYSWYLSSEKKLRSFIIVPYFRQNQIIYWQARNMDLDSKNRYDNPPLSRNNIMFNFDEIFRYTKEPLFVTEGIFDAISIGQNAIALAGSTLNPFKIEMLKRVRDREIIFVIDKDPPGKKLGESVVKAGWTITFLEGEISDANEALQKMGKIWMLNNLLQNKKTNFNAMVWLQSIKIKDKEIA